MIHGLPQEVLLTDEMLELEGLTAEMKAASFDPEHIPGLAARMASLHPLLPTAAMPARAAGVAPAMQPPAARSRRIYRLAAVVAIIFAFGSADTVIEKIRARAPEATTAHAPAATIAATTIP